MGGERVRGHYYTVCFCPQSDRCGPLNTWVLRARVWGGKGSAMAKVTEVTTTSAAFMDAVKKGLRGDERQDGLPLRLRALRRHLGHDDRAADQLRAAHRGRITGPPRRRRGV